MDYTHTLTRAAENGETITYGIVQGSNTLVFIKSGRGSNCYGYEDKYLRMAHRIHESRGYTVICSPNPTDVETGGVDESVIRDYAREACWDSFDLRLFGGSNGAYQNLLLGARMPETTRILCVNMPLMINYHKITRALMGAGGDERRVKILMVYGEKDPSAPYVPFLASRALPHVTIQRVAGADHNFAGMVEAYIELSDWM